MVMGATDARMNAKTEEEVVVGLLPFSVNGQTRQVPELKWRENRAWKAEMQATFARLVSVPADTPDGLQAMFDAELAADRLQGGFRRGAGAGPAVSPVREERMATGRTFIRSTHRRSKGALMHCL